MESMNKPRLLLITMPLAEPLLPNLAIEQLAQIARASGYECDVFYGTMRLPREIGFDLIHGSAGAALFAPLYWRVEPDYYEQVALSMGGEAATSQDLVSERALELSLAAEHASECIERCLADIEVGRYTVVGFSIGFDAQKVPSAVLARRLRQREPGLKIVAGGTGCDGPMAQALLEAFPEFDVVVRGEADNVFQKILDQLSEDGQFFPLPDVIWRERPIPEGRSPIPSTIANTPEPNYAQFLEQRIHTSRNERPLTLMLEASRGCWWGKKHHCLFCGIKAVDDDYRALNPRDLIERILALQDRYAPDLIYFTDSILDNSYYSSVLPKLAELRSQGRFKTGLFFELKSNLRREHMALLAAAGVVRAQPGIENFSSRILHAVRKGVTGLRQVAVLKWCSSYGVQLIYGLLTGTPEETADDLLANERICNRLHHLPPPISVNRLGLHRFSPYFEDPEKYGFRDVGPSKIQRLCYAHVSADVLRDLCYELDYSLSRDSDYVAALSSLEKAVYSWQARHAGGESLTCARTREGNAVILRITSDGAPILTNLSGLSAKVMFHADAPTRVDTIAKNLQIDVKDALYHVDDLVDAGLMLAEGDEVLSLPILSGAHAWNDSAAIRTRGIVRPINSFRVEREVYARS